MNTRNNTVTSLRTTIERVVAGLVFGSAAVLAIAGPFLMSFSHSI